MRCRTALQAGLDGQCLRAAPFPRLVGPHRSCSSAPVSSLASSRVSSTRRAPTCISYRDHGTIGADLVPFAPPLAQYVWSFLEHFSDKVDWRKNNPTLPNVMVFEQALLDCSPPSASPRTSNRVKPKPVTAVAQRAALANGGRSNGRAASPASSLSSLEDDDVDAEEKAAVLAAVDEPIDPVPAIYPAEAPQPPESDLIRQVCEMFQENLKPIKELTDYHGKKTWFHFLINFVSNRFNQDPYFRGGFRWETNLLRTKGLKPGQESERKFWTLRWEDKVRSGSLACLAGLRPPRLSRLAS